MKLSITQIILGALIIFTACFIVGWMTYQAPDYLRMPKLEGGGFTGYVDVMPEHQALFAFSKYGTYFLPALGILLIISGAVRAARPGARARELALITLTAGVLTGALACIIAVYGFPTSFYRVDPENSDRLIHMLINPAKAHALTQLAAGLTGFFSLGVIGCGIAQLIKMRKTPV
jgi:hypothetical protein